MFHTVCYLTCASRFPFVAAEAIKQSCERRVQASKARRAKTFADSSQASFNFTRTAVWCLGSISAALSYLVYVRTPRTPSRTAAGKSSLCDVIQYKRHRGRVHVHVNAKTLQKLSKPDNPVHWSCTDNVLTDSHTRVNGQWMAWKTITEVPPLSPREQV